MHVSTYMLNADLEKASDYKPMMSQTIWKNMPSGKKVLIKHINSYERQMAWHHVWTNTHLIRQKKDFSCMQSDGDDSGMGGKKNDFIQTQHDPAERWSGSRLPQAIEFLTPTHQKTSSLTEIQLI